MPYRKRRLQGTPFTTNAWQRRLQRRIYLFLEPSGTLLSLWDYRFQIEARLCGNSSAAATVEPEMEDQTTYLSSFGNDHYSELPSMNIMTS